jgi:hypothetical protein
MRQEIYLVIFSFVTMGIIDLAAGDFEHFVMRSLLLSSILIFAVWINKGNRYIQM